ncbi:MAG: cyclopentanol dehydrogenase [Dehalococcoidia bacterium]|nr:cyclopentanol dehydrogenase [Dehalococcoidia bacterium]|tara:strand:- start:2333 stop:3079 length:747 start_codon:yes stop_codon:yes gene_type:complete
MGRLDGKVALVTGSARGQGEAEARLFSEEGASVVVADVRKDEGTKVAAEIAETGGNAEFVHLDTTDAEAWEKAVRNTVSSFGKLDILVNNAAIWKGEGGIEDIASETWDVLFNVNCKAAFLGMQAAIPEMRRVGGGSIINVGSTLARHGAATSAAYSGAKAALALVTRSAALQYASEKIRVNIIHPGSINTPMLREGTHGKHLDIANRIPIGRLGQPIDIAYGALYLAGDEASFVTGIELVIDGGTQA